ncbi:CAP-associated domain-containing protein [Ferdinandcohnia quinoae]|uniref:CAP domain-containing protein n=1 Tax=Fredinandcohnia quinoae TaxID=2918902 RepID=A0AAW5E2S1_9BACI|nr:CAP domain-containing protein [Fredinandcohnia sp. SECRCQ15]
MRRVLLFLSFIFFLYASWTVYVKLEGNTSNQSVISTITDEMDFSIVTDKIKDSLEYIITIFQEKNDQLPQDQKRPNLTSPKDQVFSVYNIELGNTKSEVERQAGVPQRTSSNEYGVQWYTYHENYQNFVMVAYDDTDKVAGLYTNQDLISSSKGIKQGSTKSFVHDTLGDPLIKILKGTVYYQFQDDRDYDMFHLDDSYVTIFYDKHQKNTVTAMQIIGEQLEESKTEFYTEASKNLKEGFEYQLFDLTNAERINHGLTILSWDDHVKETARKHSYDMAENQYFSHTNLQGQSPFDRMLEDEVMFNFAGENLAFGQFSSIFAHEGLMNSLGHRENILQKEYEFLGVGVAFDSESHPYFTENFYAN